MNRSLNRHVYNYDDISNKLENIKSNTYKIFFKLLNLIEIRKKQKAFHPNATQYTLNLGKKFFAVWRQSHDKKQSIFAISNISTKRIHLDLNTVNIIKTEKWYDLILKKQITSHKNKLWFEPYQSIWISNILND